jgi:hypothetical protein
MPTGSDGIISNEPCRSLHHDSAPSDTSVFTHQFLAKTQMAVIPHPKHSPGLAPCDFFLYPKMKWKLKGHLFDTIEETQAESQRVLDTLIEKNSRKRSKNGGAGGTGVYIREGTTSTVTAADRSYCEFQDFLQHQSGKFCLPLRTHTYIYTYTSTYINTYLHTYIRIRIHIYIYSYIIA